MTESHSNADGPAPEPVLTVIFDGYCGFCTRCAEFGQRLDPHARVRFLAHQAPGVRERFGITRPQAEYQIWAIDASGGKRGGAQAAAAILDTILGSRGLFERLAGLPGVEQGLDRAYQWVARNRGRFPGMTPWCQSHAGQCGR